MSKLFLDTNELRRMGMSEPNIRTLIKLLEFANTQAAVEEVEETVGTVTTDITALLAADIALDERIDALEAEALDPTLEALADYDTNGLLTQTATDTFVGRTIVGPAAGLTVTDGDGVAGNPTLALANDLAALEALSGTNIIPLRSAADTWGAVTIGTGLDLTAGTLTSTVTGGGGYIPMVDGSVPPNLVYEPDGSLVLVPYP